jgi:hypothetical protein
LDFKVKAPFSNGAFFYIWRNLALQVNFAPFFEKLPLRFKGSFFKLVMVRKLVTFMRKNGKENDRAI